MKKQFIRAAATTALGLSLTTGFAAASTGSISTTGPDSNNKIITKNSRETNINNDNDVRLNNTNTQHATSGRVEVKENTKVGGVWSGDATNRNSTNASVNIRNSSYGGYGGGGSYGGGGGSIRYTGPDSNNVIVTKNENELNVHNDNNVTIDNHNTQTATSGSVYVKDNTKVGNVSSGDATNTNTSSFNVRISN